MVFSKQDAWRRHPVISGLWRDPFPGLRPAIVVFSAYCLAEYAWKRANTEQKVAPEIEYTTAPSK